MGIKARHLIGLAALGGLAWYLRDKNLTHVIARGALDFPASKQNPSQLLKALEDTQTQLSRKFRDLPDTPENRKQLGHILAIERWGTNRLKVFNGAEYHKDSSHEYYPADDATWEDLMNQFVETRLETIRVGQEALANGKDQKVEHNQLGPLSPAGWLKYLNYHAYLEATKFKKAEPVSTQEAQDSGSQTPGLQS
ncbi:hypothetical protein [Deinococcus cellulosilyticus]|uniref:DinB-like domain-containing protein n=1 Tax=Deinococcus cellulosilyticus (strain DSM 18568 / NBRC 106333 / KACC 11606 / 5516J-15) TaxID=1223518 RepID=A0A511N6I6_DEIC1|nr:hypothetical protein [Deinococcus cellulosilyticus]GEM48046.1 hypothetical protein DC3_36810 [Deinococcus cellulosilyticus NBRC 106333 = KACC 11606]